MVREFEKGLPNAATFPKMRPVVAAAFAGWVPAEAIRGSLFVGFPLEFVGNDDAIGELCFEADGFASAPCGMTNE